MNLREFNEPQKIIRSLSLDIRSNEVCHPKNPQLRGEQIEQVYDWWVSDDSITEMINWIQLFPTDRNEALAKNSPTLIELFSVGLLGLARQHVVDLNTQLKTADEEKRQSIIASLDEVNENVYKKMKFNKLPNITIHGDPISWYGELGQDRGVSFERIGRIDDAFDTYTETIRILENQLDQHRSQRNIEIQKPAELTGKNKIKQEIATLFGRLPQIVDYQAEDTYEAAMQSALAVNKVRLGKLKHSTKLAWEGVLLQRSSMKQRKDESRMNDLTKMTAKTSLENIARIQTFPWAMLALGFTGLKAYSELKILGK